MYYIYRKNNLLLEKIVKKIPVSFSDLLGGSEIPDLGSDITYKVIEADNNLNKPGDIINTHTNNLECVGCSLEMAMEVWNNRH